MKNLISLIFRSNEVLRNSTLEPKLFLIIRAFYWTVASEARHSTGTAVLRFNACRLDYSDRRGSARWRARWRARATRSGTSSRLPASCRWTAPRWTPTSRPRMRSTWTASSRATRSSPTCSRSPPTAPTSATSAGVASLRTLSIAFIWKQYTRTYCIGNIFDYCVVQYYLY